MDAMGKRIASSFFFVCKNCGKRALQCYPPCCSGSSFRLGTSTKSRPAFAQDNKKMEALANGNGEDCGTHSYFGFHEIRDDPTKNG